VKSPMHSLRFLRNWACRTYHRQYGSYGAKLPYCRRYAQSNLQEVCQFRKCHKLNTLPSRQALESTDMKVTKSRAMCGVVVILLSTASMIAEAQSPTHDRGATQETQVRGYWIDPSTGLMWAGKDSGKDMSWKAAVKYCGDLRLAGYSDWRLADMFELQGLY